jgi:hypothetical protein
MATLELALGCNKASIYPMAQTALMQPQTLPAGWLTLRPFSAADIPWVHEVLLTEEAI